MLTIEQKAANKEARIAARKEIAEITRISEEKNQSPVAKITISIEWRKSRTWGANPYATAEIVFQNGKYERNEGFTASGCGYDKESTVIGEIFNTYMKYSLWTLGIEKLKGGNGSLSVGPAPYGIHVYSDNRPHFGGGIGTNCYYAIAKYIGGEFKHVTSGKTFDVYEFTAV